MHKRSKVLLTALVAVFALSLAAGTAAALRSLSLSPGGSLTSTASRLTFESESGQVICNVTLDGTIDRNAVAKNSMTQFGRITRGTTRECSSNIFGATGANAIVLAAARNFPVEYNGFAGTLPNITLISLLIVEAAFLLEIRTPLGTVNCLYKGTNIASANAPRVTTITPGPEQVPLFDESLNRSIIACPLEGSLVGSIRLSVTQTLRLI